MKKKDERTWNEAIQELQEQPKNTLAANPNPAEQHLYRTDTWWISNEYLTLAANMVALQLIAGEEKFANWEEFEERVTYVLRQNCPVAYSYLFDKHVGVGAIPAGFANVVRHITKERYADVIPGDDDAHVN